MWMHRRNLLPTNSDADGRFDDDEAFHGHQPAHYRKLFFIALLSLVCLCVLGGLLLLRRSSLPQTSSLHLNIKPGIKSNPVSQKKFAEEKLEVVNIPPPLRGASAGFIRIAVVLVCFNRPDYIKRTLESIQKAWPVSAVGNVVFEFLVSQDGVNAEVDRTVRSFAKHFPLRHLHFDYNEKEWQKGKERFNPQFKVYYRISNHFNFVLKQVFERRDYARVIFLEDDMDLAPDFFSYFAALSPVLEKDSSALCVSAWNDNGQRRFVESSTTLMRSDVFPGLGWMMTRKLWTELAPKWPGGFWDDWLRVEEQHKGRTCIFPEVNRVYTFGEKGSSGGLFFNKYLRPIHLNTENIDWSTINTSVVMKEPYEHALAAELASAETLSTDVLQLPLTGNEGRVIKVRYSSEVSFGKIANAMGLMSEWRAQKPRASYGGVVRLRFRGAVVLLVPEQLPAQLRLSSASQ